MQGTKNFVRLAIERELTDKEIRAFFEFVEEVADVEYTAAYDKAGKEVDNDAVVTMYHNGVTYLYEIAVEEPIEIDEGDEIVEDLVKLIDDDFDLDVTGVDYE